MMITLSNPKQLRLLAEGLVICLKRKDDCSLPAEMRKQFKEQADYYLDNLLKVAEEIKHEN